MTEDDLLTAVLDLARLLGLHAAHFRPAWTDRGWRTAVQADGKGYPDLTIVGPGGVLFRELKSATGRSSREQQVWAAKLEEARADFAVWRPGDLRTGRINAELRALRVRNSERQETR